MPAPVLSRRLGRLLRRIVRWSALPAACAFLLSMAAAAEWSLGGRPVPGPLPPDGQQPAPGLDVRLDLAYGQADGIPLKLDFAKPSLCRGQKVPLVVYIHGGGWVTGDKSDVFDMGISRMLFQLGMAVASVNYRLAPEARFPAQIQDCRLAVRYLRNEAGVLGIDPDRIGVTGASAGAHLALLVGLAGPEDGLDGEGLEGVSSAVSSVVNLFGPTDLTEVDFIHQAALVPFLGCPPAVCPARAQAASPVTYVSPDDPPVLTVHGEKDGLVPYDQAVIISRRLREAGNACGLVKVKNADHGFIPNPPGAAIQPSLPEIEFMVVAHLARWLEPGAWGDLNLDGRVDETDLFELLRRLGSEGVGPSGGEAPDSWNPLADIWPDGRINYRDVQVFRHNWMRGS